MDARDNSELPVLLVDDEPAALSCMIGMLQGAGIGRLLTCRDSRQVLPLLGGQEAEVILLALAMPHLSGEELLGRIRESFPQIPVIVLTTPEDIGAAVRCLRAGACDYMVKAVEPGRLVSGVQRAIDLRRMSRRYETLRRHLLDGRVGDPAAFAAIITRNRRMRAIFVYIESIAPTAETVLVSGETGCGQELVAEAIHAASGRQGPLLKMEAAEVGDALAAGTLFGPAGGTLFLDEIGGLSPASQLGLLRLIESRATDTRFLLATRQNLPERVRQGQFRRDLYCRLQTFEIRVPPLRERREDLPPLLDAFLDQAARAFGRKRLLAPPELLSLLQAYDFPGNVRELRAMVFDAASRQKERILSLRPFREAMGHTGEPVLPPAAAGDLSFPDRLPTLRETVDRLVSEALSRARGNQAIAASLLGISPQALSKRLTRRRGRGARGAAAAGRAAPRRSPPGPTATGRP